MRLRSSRFADPCSRHRSRLLIFRRRVWGFAGSRAARPRTSIDQISCAARAHFYTDFYPPLQVHPSARSINHRQHDATVLCNVCSLLGRCYCSRSVVGYPPPNDRNLHRDIVNSTADVLKYHSVRLYTRIAAYPLANTAKYYR